eukprot:TRINITY_DN16730_c0_g1_i1.p1 TRINITY_DN16730_c0_g1~~TRINITY_DN16730_c0_g1_i1.p1  ORF type:complete len:534 (+),score=72.01 TRINITY_DN16730_c0_g1_i1:163-1764(+)
MAHGTSRQHDGARPLTAETLAAALRAGPPFVYTPREPTFKELSLKGGGWRPVPLILLVGLGSHAAKNALAPVQPHLMQLGLSPFLYSLCAAAPQLASVFMPAVWGLQYSRHEKCVLVAVPCGVFVGQAILAIAFVMLNYEIPAWEELATLVAGFVIFSLCRSGVGVVQHSALTRALQGRQDNCLGLTTGFVAVTGFTHFAKAVCQFCIPRVLEKGGLLGVQLSLLPFSALSVLAGVVLSAKVHSILKRRTKPPLMQPFMIPQPAAPALTAANAEPATIEEDDSVSPLTDRCESIDSDGLPRHLSEAFQKGTSTDALAGRFPLPPLERGCSFPRQTSSGSETPAGYSVRTAVVLLGLWRALVVGMLHSFESFTNDLLVSRGMTKTGAGSLVGTTVSISIFCLPLVGLLGDFVGRRILIVVTSLTAFLSALTLCCSTSNGDGICWLEAAAIMALSFCGMMAPVLPLALVPCNTKSVGKSFGFLDSLFSLAQVIFLTLMGTLLQVWSYQAVLRFCTSCFAVATVLSVVVLRVVQEH